MPLNDDVFKMLSIVREIYLKGYCLPEIGPGLFVRLLILQLICLDITEPLLLNVCGSVDTIIDRNI